MWDRLMIGLFFVLSLVPARYGLVIGRVLGSLLYVAAGGRRKIIEKNIGECFPELTEKQRNCLCKQIFLENSIGLIEASWVWFRRSTALDRLVVRFHGVESLRNAINRERGILLLCPHQSMLDLICPFIFKVYGKFSVTYRPHKNRVFDEQINYGRSQYSELIPVRDVRRIVCSLKKRDLVWFAPDQDMGARGAVFAPFFGRAAATVTTPSRLARITGCSVLFMSVSRERLSYTVRFESMSDDYPVEDEVANATELNEKIEASVRLKPAQYMWMHRRFKTNSDGSRHTFYD